VLGNVGSLIVFRVGAEDAEKIATELGIHSPSALTDLANFTAWAKLMRCGNPTEAIRIDTAYPEILHHGRADAIIARTRARHARPRATVEDKIARFMAPPS